MKPMRRRSLVIGLAAVAIVLGAISLFTPALGRARFGPMRGFGMGPMSFSVMREAHAMADVESELEYMIRMIPHHQEAVDTAEELLDRTDRPEMEAFAESIIATQSREIQRMRSWLADWYPERDTDADYEPMMRDYAGLSGSQLDLAFLQDMIPHHMAAVMMSEQLLTRVRVEHEELEALARRIRTSQLQEIRQMGLWLEKWFG